MQLNPLLTQMRTYPFVALDEARRSALAAGLLRAARRARRAAPLPGRFRRGWLFRLALVPTMEEYQRAVAILEEVL